MGPGRRVSIGSGGYTHLHMSVNLEICILCHKGMLRNSPPQIEGHVAQDELKDVYIIEPLASTLLSSSHPGTCFSWSVNRVRLSPSLPAFLLLFLLYLTFSPPPFPPLSLLLPPTLSVSFSPSISLSLVCVTSFPSSWDYQEASIVITTRQNGLQTLRSPNGWGISFTWYYVVFFPVIVHDLLHYGVECCLHFGEVREVHLDGLQWTVWLIKLMNANLLTETECYSRLNKYKVQQASKYAIVLV